MEKISGRLEMLGSSTTQSGTTTYSVLEIGDHVLKGIRVSSALDNFLQRGLGSTLDIWVNNNTLWGLKFNDGKAYRSSALVNSSGVVIGYVIGIATLPIIIGYFFLWKAFKAQMVLKSSNLIKQELPDAIEVGSN